MSDSATELLDFPWPDPPAEGEAVEIATGILWLRLPLPMALDHINIYALDDDESWTIVDTGIYSRRTIAIWEKLLSGPLQGRPVGRVLLTHAHPDHVGMVGWLAERFDATLVTSQISYAMARMLILDVEDSPTPQAMRFWKEAGMDPDIYARRADERPFNFADICAPLRPGYRRIKQDDTLRIGGRNWDVHIGNGHAPGHVTLWSRDDPFVLSGDQILPSISPNIGVYPNEPLANPLSEWLESCTRLSALARPEHIVLCGHNRPFTGLPVRMRQLADNHHGALTRLCDYLQTPRTACECFPVLFRRKVDAGTYGLAMAEAVAHLNYLLHCGAVTRTQREDGAWLWHNKE